MKVYRVSNDVERYQYFLTEREEDIFKLKMDCTPIKDIWQPPPVFVYMPKRKPGDFYNFNSDILITSPRSTEVLHEFLELAGELLPLPYHGQIYTILNVTMCIDCLDHEKTEWLIDELTGIKSLPIKYVFHKDRFASSRIFKIPETCGGEILVVDKEQNEGEELHSVVIRAGLHGLVFEELWNDHE